MEGRWLEKRALRENNTGARHPHARMPTSARGGLARPLNEEEAVPLRRRRELLDEHARSLDAQAADLRVPDRPASAAYGRRRPVGLCSARRDHGAIIAPSSGARQAASHPWTNLNGKALRTG